MADSPELHRLSIDDALTGLAEHRFSAVELLDACMARIRRHDAQVGAFLALNEPQARAAAAASDRRRAQGEALGLLDGIPVAVKDNIVTRGLTTTAASRILENFVPPYDATVIARLKAEGAVIVGKANLDEFAMGSSTERSAFHPTRNPWDLGRVPGGSSGGSAASVAASFVPGSLGSDTGGSIRQPAALTGTVGLKPTYGRISRFGLIAFASSLDQIGPFSRTVADNARLYAAIAGHDLRDSTSIDQPRPNFSAWQAALNTPNGDKPLAGLKLGLPREYFSQGGLDADVARRLDEALAVYRSLGAETVEVSLPHTRFAVATYYVLATSEASSNLARYDGVRFGRRAKTPVDIRDLYDRSRAEGFGAEVQRRILLGTYCLSAGYYDAYYLQAMKVRALIQRDFSEAFAHADLLFTPTTPDTAFAFGERTDDPLKMYLADIFTIACNLAGIPGMSLPAGLDRRGLPVGQQLLGPHWSEEKMLSVAAAYESAVGGFPHAPEAALERQI